MTVLRRLPLVTIVGLVAAACAGSTSATTGAIGTTSTAPPPTTDTSVVETTSTQPEETTTSTTVALTPILDDGRPATFMAVTDDFEAVEVDTATGEIVRSFGQRATAAELESGDEIAPNVVDGIWRTASGETVLISECCEPAGGNLSFLTGDQQLDRDYANQASQGWWVVPAANSEHVIITGYITEIVDASRGASTPDAITLFENDGSGVGAIGWSIDGNSIYWLDEGAGALTTWNRTTGGVTVALTVSIDWIGPDQHIFGLDTQASGNLVSFLTRFNADGEPTDTQGIVYSPGTGELLAMFPIPAGSSFGGYDPSGQFLIYTTRDGDVMYQGLGQVNRMGEAYLFASW